LAKQTPLQTPIRKIGWSDEEFETIIEEALKPRKKVVATDISSPPGTRKTYNVLRYAVRHRLPLIASFPTHANQATALRYIAEHLSREKAERLPFYVVDYAGVENYCLFYRPRLLMRFLDRWRGEGESYREAVDNMLEDERVLVFVLSAVDEVEDLWARVGEALDEYAETGDYKAYAARIAEITEVRERSRVCRTACPIGWLQRAYRDRVRRDLRRRRIITWRRDLAGQLRRRYPKLAGDILVADPEQVVDEFDSLVAGHYKLEPLLCPRYILTNKVVAGKENRPQYLTVRRSIILVPHSGLDFVVRTVRRAHEVQGYEMRHKLFIDEYDAALKPAAWRLWPLDALDELMAIADAIVEAGLGAELDGYVVDEYLLRYAEWVRDVAAAVKRIVREHVVAGTYHPLTVLFFEGAFSALRDTMLKPGLVYPPFMPRPVHIKYFADGNVLQLVFGVRRRFEDLARVDGAAWRQYFKQARAIFARLARRRVSGLYPTVESSGVVRLRRRTRAENLHDIVEDLKSLLRPLLDYPRYAVYYTFDPPAIVRLASIDIPLLRVLSTEAILVSASPLNWAYYIHGPNPPLGVAYESTYHKLAAAATHSLVRITADDRAVYEYANRRVQHYKVKIWQYANRDEIVSAIRAGTPLPTPKIKTRDGIIRQISVEHRVVDEYSNLLRVYRVPRFGPLFTPPGHVPREYAHLVRAKMRASLLPYRSTITELARRRQPTLVLVQNKTYAHLLIRAYRAEKCRGDVCGPDVRRETHYQAGPVTITWFRSRAERGIDLPHDYKFMVVVGSPYPRPTSPAPATAGPSILTTNVISQVRAIVWPLNSPRPMLVRIGHTPRDVASGIAELVQAIGRATRAAMRSGHTVTVLIPAALSQKIHIYAPRWIRNKLL